MNSSWPVRARGKRGLAAARDCGPAVSERAAALAARPHAILPAERQPRLPGDGSAPWRSAAAPQAREFVRDRTAGRVLDRAAHPAATERLLDRPAALRVNDPVEIGTASVREPGWQSLPQPSVVQPRTAAEAARDTAPLLHAWTTGLRAPGPPARAANPGGSPPGSLGARLVGPSAGTATMSEVAMVRALASSLPALETREFAAAPTAVGITLPHEPAAALPALRGSALPDPVPLSVAPGGANPGSVPGPVYPAPRMAGYSTNGVRPFKPRLQGTGDAAPLAGPRRCVALAAGVPMPRLTLPPAEVLVPRLIVSAVPLPPDAIPFARSPQGYSGWLRLLAPAPSPSGAARIRREPVVPAPDCPVAAAARPAHARAPAAGPLAAAVRAGLPMARRIPAPYAAGTPGVLRPYESPPAPPPQQPAHLPERVIGVSNLFPAPLSGPAELDLRWRPSRRRWMRAGNWRSPGTRFLFAAPAWQLFPGDFADAVRGNVITTETQP